jgi:subtilase family serine protease
MITIESSKISNISPALPEIKIISPTANQNLTGVYTISFNITGEDISKVLVLLNGQEITEFSGNGTFSYALNTTKYPDGSYTIEVEAIQADGLYTKSSVTVNFENQLENLYTNVKANETSLSSSINNLDNSLTSVKTSLSTLIYITLGLAVIAIIIGIVAIIISRRRK